MRNLYLHGFDWPGVRSDGQGQERGLVEEGKELGAGLFLTRHLFMVELRKQRSQGLVDVVETEELSVA